MAKQYIVIRQEDSAAKRRFLKNAFYFLLSFSDQMPVGGPQTYQETIIKRVQPTTAEKYSDLIISLFGLRKLGYPGICLSEYEKKKKDAYSKKRALLKLARQLYNDSKRKPGTKTHWTWEHFTQFDEGFRGLFSDDDKPSSDTIQIRPEFKPDEVEFLKVKPKENDDDREVTIPSKISIANLLEMKHNGELIELNDPAVLKVIVSERLCDTVVHEKFAASGNGGNRSELIKIRCPLRRDLEYCYTIYDREKVIADGEDAFPKSVLKFYDELDSKDRQKHFLYESTLKFFRHMGDFDGLFFKYGMISPRTNLNTHSNERHVVFREIHPIELNNFAKALQELGKHDKHSNIPHPLWIEAKLNDTEILRPEIGDSLPDGATYLKFKFEPGDQKDFSCFDIAKFNFRVFGIRSREQKNLRFSQAEDTLGSIVKVDLTNCNIDFETIDTFVFGTKLPDTKTWSFDDSGRLNQNAKGGFVFHPVVVMDAGQGAAIVWHDYIKKETTHAAPHFATVK